MEVFSFKVMIKYHPQKWKSPLKKAEHIINYTLIR